jgi:hypothetical protein
MPPVFGGGQLFAFGFEIHSLDGYIKKPVRGIHHWR